MIDQHHIHLSRRLSDVEDRISQPVDTGHSFAIKGDFLPQGAAHALDDVALDALGEPVGIDDLPAVVRDRELARPDLAGRPIDINFGDDGDAGAIALRIGYPAARYLVTALVAPRRCPRLPPCFLG